ncbi:MAG: methylenetetrahydrofolate reductase [NAD(P)H] [Nitrospirae bacterium GWC2_57_9]|nr:MAG: methylenetetrahydrofolate reductase [NAD(P)H] [Nitrospirae bacterium GWC2_57_9]
MKLRDIFKTRSQGISFEVFPPKSEDGKDALLNTVKDLSGFDPLYVSVSYGAGGTTQERTLMTLRWLRQETSLSLMSHLTCVGSSRASMDSLLREFQSLGVENILALRGDPPKSIPDFDPLKGEFKYARDLVEFVRDYKAFSIAVAAYPEGHRESPSIEKDLEYTKQKIDAGADIAITQMFFDNRYYYEFRERASRAGISVPILPGIMPIVDCRKMVTFAEACSTTIPQEILDRMEPVLDLPEEMRKLGVEFAIRQCQDLIRNGVRYIHFYSMNRAETMRDILSVVRYN